MLPHAFYLAYAYRYPIHVSISPCWPPHANLPKHIDIDAWPPEQPRCRPRRTKHQCIGARISPNVERRPRGPCPGDMLPPQPDARTPLQLFDANGTLVLDHPLGV